MFLRIEDYWSYIQEDDLNVILSDTLGNPDQAFLLQAENASVGQIKSYLSPRYDVEKIFRDLKIWVITTAYVIGDYVAFATISDDIYTALTDTTGSSPDSNPNDWEKVDGRDALIVSLVIDVTLYNIHSRINPRNVPEIRLQRRDESIKWLTMVSKAEVQADLPRLEDDVTGLSIQFGGETKKQNSF